MGLGSLFTLGQLCLFSFQSSDSGSRCPQGPPDSSYQSPSVSQMTSGEAACPTTVPPRKPLSSKPCRLVRSAVLPGAWVPRPGSSRCHRQPPAGGTETQAGGCWGWRGVQLGWLAARSGWVVILKEQGQSSWYSGSCPMFCLAASLCPAAVLGHQARARPGTLSVRTLGDAERIPAGLRAQPGTLSVCTLADPARAAGGLRARLGTLSVLTLGDAARAPGGLRARSGTVSVLTLADRADAAAAAASGRPLGKDRALCPPAVPPPRGAGLRTRSPAY